MSRVPTSRPARRTVFKALFFAAGWLVDIMNYHLMIDPFRPKFLLNAGFIITMSTFSLNYYSHNSNLYAHAFQVVYIMIRDCFISDDLVYIFYTANSTKSSFAKFCGIGKNNHFLRCFYHLPV